MVNSPLRKRNDGSRVVVKLNSVSVQWWTLRTLSWLKLLIVPIPVPVKPIDRPNSFVYIHSYTNE